MLQILKKLEDEFNQIVGGLGEALDTPSASLEKQLVSKISLKRKELRVGNNKFKLILVSIVGVVFLIIVLNRPVLRLPKEFIEYVLIYEMKMGTNIDSVVNYIQKKNYKIEFDFPGSYVHGDESEIYNKKDKPVGSRFLRVDMGGYRGFPFRVDVVAYFVFNEKNELIKVEVFKDVDAL